MKSLVITIDGPAGVGKGTLARRLSDYFNLKYLDTGRLYRAVALRCFDTNTPLDQEEKVLPLAQSFDVKILLDPRLKNNRIAQDASQIAAYSKVRDALLGVQKRFCTPPFDPQRGVVLDGRDIGTKICPQAEFKFFLKADQNVRAQRRFEELHSQYNEVIYEDIFRDLVRRDHRDRSRIHSPLEVASGAVVIDTSHLNADEVFQKAAALIQRNS